MFWKSFKTENSPDPIDAWVHQHGRSFGLLLGRLPPAMREPLQVSYLLARSADTIADHPNLDVSKKISTLELLFKTFGAVERGGSVLLPKELSDFGKENSLATRESQLLAMMPSLLARFCTDPALTAAKKTLGQLVGGMIVDAKRSQVSTVAELQKHLVDSAGCVGPYWHELSKVAFGASLFESGKEPAAEYSIAFGCALQWVNVIRDSESDYATLGREYLPCSARENSTGSDLSASNAEKFYWRAVELLPLLRKDFDMAADYVSRIRSHQLSYKSLLLFPLALGVETLELWFQSAHTGKRVGKVPKWRALLLWSGNRWDDDQPRRLRERLVRLGAS